MAKLVTVKRQQMRAGKANHKAASSSSTDINDYVDANAH
jgi:hypothetical protein